MSQPKIENLEYSSSPSAQLSCQSSSLSDDYQTSNPNNTNNNGKYMNNNITDNSIIEKNNFVLVGLEDGFDTVDTVGTADDQASSFDVDFVEDNINTIAPYNINDITDNVDMYGLLDGLSHQSSDSLQSILLKTPNALGITPNIAENQDNIINSNQLLSFNFNSNNNINNHNNKNDNIDEIIDSDNKKCERIKNKDTNNYSEMSVNNSTINNNSSIIMENDDKDSTDEYNTNDNDSSDDNDVTEDDDSDDLKDNEKQIKPKYKLTQVNNNNNNNNNDSNKGKKSTFANKIKKRNNEMFNKLYLQEIEIARQQKGKELSFSEKMAIKRKLNSNKTISATMPNNYIPTFVRNGDYKPKHKGYWWSAKEEDRYVRTQQKLLGIRKPRYNNKSKNNNNNNDKDFNSKSSRKNKVKPFNPRFQF